MCIRDRDKIDQLNDAELDEMAWELNIQWYDSTAPIETKRAVIRSSDRVYAKLGTCLLYTSRCV